MCNITYCAQWWPTADSELTSFLLRFRIQPNKRHTRTVRATNGPDNTQLCDPKTTNLLLLLDDRSDHQSSYECAADKFRLELKPDWWCDAVSVSERAHKRPATVISFRYSTCTKFIQFYCSARMRAESVQCSYMPMFMVYTKNTYVFITCIKNRYLFMAKLYEFHNDALQSTDYYGTVHSANKLNTEDWGEGGRRASYEKKTIIIIEWIFSIMNSVCVQCTNVQCIFQCRYIGWNAECLPFGYVFAAKPFYGIIYALSNHVGTAIYYYSYMLSWDATIKMRPKWHRTKHDKIRKCYTQMDRTNKWTRGEGYYVTIRAKMMCIAVNARTEFQLRHETGCPASALHTISLFSIGRAHGRLAHIKHYYYYTDE